MDKRLIVVLGGLFFAVQFLYAGTSIYRSLTSPTPASVPGWEAADRGGHVFVSIIEAESLGLKPGDEVVAVEGIQFKSSSDLVNSLRQLEIGEPYTMLIRHEGQPNVLTLKTQPVPLLRITPVRGAMAIILALFLITGLGVFILKPYDKQGWLLALMFGTLTGAIPLLSSSDLPGWFSYVAFFTRIALLLAAPVMFHFFLTFPEPSPLIRRFPRFQVYLYVPYLVSFVPYAAVILLTGTRPDETTLAGRVFGLLGQAGSMFIPLYVAGGLLSLLVNYKQADRTSKRKMRVIVAGSIAGFLPALLCVAAIQVFDLPKTNPALLEWCGLAALFAFPLFPLSFAYAIVRHQVIPVRLMLRRGVRYVFVSQGSIVLEIVAVFLSLAFLLYSFFAYLNTTSGLEIGVISGVVSIVVWEFTGLLHRRVIAPAIDRRFFRQAYNAQQVLSELGIAMRSLTDISEMGRLVCSKVQDALHTENITILVEESESGDFVPITFWTPDGSRPVDRNLVLPADGYCAERLKAYQAPLLVDHRDQRSWTRYMIASAEKGARANRIEQETLKAANTAMLVPIASKDRLQGIIELGRRLSDLPFSREDKQLLSAVASQMALSIENSQLVRRMAEEERLRHELDVAAQVQRRLFPETPELETLELWGVCHPARGVGGDYYDFLSFDDGRIGLAVADVAGKGISAALLMSIVQASLRSQAPSVDGKLTDLVASMNSLLFRSTGPNGYATFFYAQFDERSKRLTYVNAGHNPPILVRSSASVESARLGAGSEAELQETKGLALAASSIAGQGRRVSSERVEENEEHAEKAREFELDQLEECISPLVTGGMVIGLFEDCKYEQETIQLGSGDLIVAYTDGVTEAMNPNTEEFGEARLRKVVATSGHLSAEDLSHVIIQAVHEWRANLEQHDDLTLVIMKVR
jgi:sigma-B regulation protein RsbU (phosphoserine phosphatase)